MILEELDLARELGALPLVIVVDEGDEFPFRFTDSDISGGGRTDAD